MLRVPSPAMVVACLALTVALSGVGYAAVALPRNSVGTAQLKSNAVTSAKVRANALTGADVNEAKLGRVPAAANAENAANAQTAQSAANADRLDNLDSTAFSQAGHDHDDRYFTETEADARYVKTTDETVFAFGQIREDASVRNGSSRVASVTKVATGLYCVVFTAPAPSQVRLEGAVVGLAGSSTSALFPRVTNGQAGGAGCPSGQLDIEIVNASGANANGRFSFIVP